MGDHDAGEAAGGLPGTTEEEGNWGIVSPTIGLVAASGVPNSFGLTLEQATPTQGYHMQYEFYMGIFDIFNQGNAWQFTCQTYPALQVAGGPAPGTPNWGEQRLPQFLYFNPLVQCYSSLEDLGSQGQILSANGSGLARPDSIRISLRKLQQCYRFGVTTGCSPTDGAYMDNTSFAIIDGTPQAMSVDIWNWINDAFPFNETAGLPGTANFDTTSALLRTGFNIAQTTGDAFRYDVPGDSVVINAADSPTEPIRLDMVFRIKPGVGNYITIGVPTSGLRAVPTSTAAAGAGSFWGQFISTPGEFATPGSAALDAGWPGGWNPNVWRSARCDTAQVGLFPVAARGFGDVGTNDKLDANVWMSSFHESDAHYTTLGISKHKCFIVDTLGGTTAANVTCSTVPAWLLNAPLAARAGYDGNANSVEATQILPDGLLTPGAHVEYFFTKRTVANPAVFDMCPDTNTVFPQSSEGPSFDAHRWQQFGVLPDRWKDANFTPGSTMACALYVDLNDRRGDERVFVSVADSIGATAATRRGAHNGWGGVPAGVSLNTPAYYVSSHGGQPGSTWDMYGVKASESLTTSAGALGGRLAYTDPSPTNLVHNKYARMAPTPEMLDAYYKVLIILSGDLNSGVIGPFDDRSQDDVTLLQNWLLGATLGAPRGIMIQGDGFAESAWNTSLEQEAFMTDYLGFDFYFQSYRSLAANFEQWSDLKVSTDISPTGDIYGVRNGCTYTNDVLILNPALTEASVSGQYTAVGASTFPAGVLKKSVAGRPWVSLFDGFDIVNLTGRFDMTSKGRLAYYYNALNVFGTFCTVRGAPSTTLETPNNTRFVNFVKLGNNPVENRQALVFFGLAKSDRVQLVVYDVSGRRIRTLADRVFPAGEHRLVWDGADDHGQLVPRGVYFAKTTFAGQNFQSANKMIVLN